MTRKIFAVASGNLFISTGIFLASLVHSQENISYTEAQAIAGQQTYEQRCATCHGYNLEGFELAPSLGGNLFSRRFGDRSADYLARNLQRMPPNEVGLSQDETANVLAYLFSRNGVEAIT